MFVTQLATSIEPATAWWLRMNWYDLGSILIPDDTVYPWSLSHETKLDLRLEPDWTDTTPPSHYLTPSVMCNNGIDTIPSTEPKICIFSLRNSLKWVSFIFKHILENCGRTSTKSPTVRADKGYPENCRKNLTCQRKFTHFGDFAISLRTPNFLCAWTKCTFTSANFILKKSKAK